MNKADKREEQSAEEQASVKETVVRLDELRKALVYMPKQK